jgi:hypothetical protein
VGGGKPSASLERNVRGRGGGSAPHPNPPRRFAGGGKAALTVRRSL